MDGQAGGATLDSGGVAVVEIFGSLEHHGWSWFGDSAQYETIAQAVVDGLAVGGVVLRIDSPGGTCAGLEECCRKIRAARDASANPLIAYVDELAASAAYAIACQADTIVLPPAGEVGSIGVIGPLIDESAAVLADGVKLDLVRSPSGKAAGASVQPVDHLARERMTRGVAEAYIRFAALVTERRGLAREEIDALNGDAYEGPRAIAARLADQIGSLEDAIGLAGGNAAPVATATKTETTTMQHARKAADPPEPEAPPEPEPTPEPEPETDSATITFECPEKAGGCGARWIIDRKSGKATGKPLDDDGPAEEHESAALRELLELTGAKNVSLALGVVRSWRADAEVHRKAAIAERAQREEAEKVDALKSAVASGALTPAMAWADPMASTPQPKGYWAAMDPSALKAELATYRKASAPHVAVPGESVPGADLARWGDKAPAILAALAKHGKKG